MLDAANLTKSGTLYVIIILVLLIAGGVLLTGGVFPVEQVPPAGAQTVQVDPKSITLQGKASGQKSLQLYSFGGNAIIPPQNNGSTSKSTPTNKSTTSSTTTYCPDDTSLPKSATCTCPAETLSCQNGKCAYISDSISGLQACIPGYDILCAGRSNDEYCIGKPVIYLYPTHTISVHVGLQIPGIITESIPTYPFGGWDLVAHPGGELTYEGKQYNELYYEDEVNKVNPPDTGLVIPTDKLREKLLIYTHQLGLLPNEQEEFLSYWMPLLLDLHSPYIQFSVLTPAEKERIDHVTVLPRPETSIKFIVYFKPLETSLTPLKTLLFPQTPPRRVGFTEVEWGGTIGK